MTADFVAESRPGSTLPSPELPEVAFAGRSNVGKSTLLNKICQRKGLARTSRTPGCTRGVVVYRCGLRSGVAFNLADLPGYGYAERSHDERRAWARHIEDYLQRRATLRGVMILVDARRGVEDEELQLIAWLRTINRPFVLIATKVDKLARAERDRAVAAIRRVGRCPVVATSGETGDGRDALLTELVKLLPPVLPAHTAGAQPGTALPSAAASGDDPGTALAHDPAL